MKKTKILYTCESEFDAYEYGKMSKYFPEMYWSFVLYGIKISLMFAIILGICFRNIILAIVFFMVYLLILMVFYKVRLQSIVEKLFVSWQKKGKVDMKGVIEFYEDYFVCKSEKTNSNIKYSDIDKSIETNTNFYFKYGKQFGIIQKKQCDLELISYIRKKFKNLDNCLGESEVIKGSRVTHDPKFVKVVMVILFILSIACLWLGSYSQDLVAEIMSISRFSIDEVAWVYWLWLPLPVLSIILGFRYYRAGFKCIKNIVVGLIVCFLLIVNGAFVFFPTHGVDYNSIYVYRDILGIDLPSNGDLLIYYDYPYTEIDKTNFTLVAAYYDNEDTSITNKLIENIKNNDNWFLITEPINQLESFIFSSDDDVYYSIYNKTLNKYNVLPEESGNYEIYSMEYDISDKKLKIYKFTFNKS